MLHGFETNPPQATLSDASMEHADFDMPRPKGKMEILVVQLCQKGQRLRTMRTEERKSTLAVWSAPIITKMAVSFEWPSWHPDLWGSRTLFCLKWEENWMGIARSMVLDRKGRRETGL